MKKRDFKLDVLKQKKTIKQYPKFIVSGIVGVTVNIVILYVLTELAGLYYVLSAVCAAIISSACNFIFNKTWTFKEEIEDKFVEKSFKFGIVRIIAVVLSLGLLYLLTEYAHIYYIYSQLIAVTIVGLLSFFAHKIWVFEKYRVGGK